MALNSTESMQQLQFESRQAAAGPLQVGHQLVGHELLVLVRVTDEGVVGEHLVGFAVDLLVGRQAREAESAVVQPSLQRAPSAHEQPAHQPERQQQQKAGDAHRRQDNGAVRRGAQRLAVDVGQDEVVLTRQPLRVEETAPVHHQVEE